mmetsp:Transcript_34842/g.81387  ORF Transcript_34842/g.81387 Transcript_34842/m.81387 type:complete len:236 (+) Transcript_34842:122-829(+)
MSSSMGKLWTLNISILCMVLRAHADQPGHDRGTAAERRAVAGTSTESPAVAETTSESPAEKSRLMSSVLFIILASFGLILALFMLCTCAKVCLLKSKGIAGEKDKSKKAADLPRTQCLSKAAATASDDGMNEDLCAICLQPLLVSEKIRTTPCFHSFHAECLDMWTARSATCATCRTPLWELRRGVAAQGRLPEPSAWLIGAETVGRLHGGTLLQQAHRYPESGFISLVPAQRVR